MKKNEDFTKLSSSLDTFSYLEKLDEEAIYEFYEQAFKADISAAFEGFLEVHRDAFFRLKFRSLNSRLGGNQSAPPMNSQMSIHLEQPQNIDSYDFNLRLVSLEVKMKLVGGFQTLTE
jgi:hypothetical protein